MAQEYKRVLGYWKSEMPLKDQRDEVELSRKVFRLYCYLISMKNDGEEEDWGG